jgi:ABC-type polysaccharide/polyol phosphate transport system ATPase subunit
MEPAMPALQFDNVSVCYRVPRERVSGIKEFAVRWLQRRIEYENFWALRDVSFEVQPGEFFGIIGRNGAGKSTLLKVMARVLQPVQGRLIMRGRLAPLLELGGGFHPELSGRENVYLNMALLGHPHQETDELFDAIVDFSEIRDFIDAPLRTYSTGMVARLGFSVATCVRPDILLVDEVLSVGDSQFQQKCLDRMTSFQKQGTTIVLVSHGMGPIESLCQRALLLERGRIKAIGSAEDVIKAYIEPDKLPDDAPTALLIEVIPIEPKEMLLPLRQDDYFPLSQVGGIYPIGTIFDPKQGSVSAWIKIQPGFPPKNAIIFHTDDSRYILYISAYHSSSQNRNLRRLVARAGGNRRVIDTYYGTSGFPEAGMTIEEDDIPKKIILDLDQWYLATMTWQGYPTGKLCLYIDGSLASERAYNPRYDRGDDLPKQIAIGLRPLNWVGEIVHKEDGSISELHPADSMPINEAGIEVRDIRLYQKQLSQKEILNLARLEKRELAKISTR